MLTIFRRLIVLAGLLTVSVAYGQTNVGSELNLTLGEQRVKFAPTRSFQEMRLEVVNHAGETVFTHLTTEAEFEWSLRDSNGEPLTAGLYSYVLTLKFNEEQVQQHRGSLIVEQGNGQGQQQVWLTTQDGATVSGAALNAVRSGGRSLAGFRTSDDKSVKRDVSGREIVDEKGGNLNHLTKAVKQEKAALLGTLNKVAKFDASGLPANVTDSTITEVGGNVGIGTATPTGALHVVSGAVNPLQIEMSGVAAALTAQMDNFGGGGSTGGSGFLGRAANGSRLAPTNVTAGERLGFNVFGGFAGGGFRHVAAINAHVGTGSISATSLPSYLNFMTTPDGSVARLERLRIDQNGDVGIGTTVPTHKLDVAGTINTTTQYNIDGNRIISGSGNNLFIGKDTNGFCFGGCFFATAIGVGAIAGISNSVTLGRTQDKVIIPGELSVTGNASFDGDLSISGDLNFIPSESGGPHLCYSGGKITDCSISSVRYKKNITLLKAGLSEINRLRPVNFTWKKTDENDFGLIAEEVAEAAPLLTVYDKDGAVKGVNYDKISVVLVNAVKEQQAMIQQQQGQIQQLMKAHRQTQRINQGLRQRLNRIERQTKSQQR